MPLPEQLTQIPADRIAYAPYNFIPLPAHAVPAETVDPDQRIVVPTKKNEPQPIEAQYLVRHDQYIAGRHTGTITCTLTTETPLYVRCGQTSKNYARLIELEQTSKRTPEEDKEYLRLKNDPNFFAAPSHDAVIPGSSLRGLFRTLVEIVSHSKIDIVTNQVPMFFRAVAAPNDDPLRNPYQAIIGQNRRNVQAGYLVYQDHTWSIRPASESHNHTFMEVKDKNVHLVNFPRYNDHDFNIQYTAISYTTARDRKDSTYINHVDSAGKYSLAGTIVSSGNMNETKASVESPRKKYWVVFPENKDAPLIRIDEAAINDYINGLTAYQASPPFDPHIGMLQEGRPVFYVRPKTGAVVYFGHSPNFRIPARPPEMDHATTPFDLIPAQLKTGGIGAPYVDLTEAMFGFVRQRHQQWNDKLPHLQAYAGRLRFSDAHLVDPHITDIWENEITPPILASPKPTTFQHYLVQTQTQRRALNHYGTHGALIRGHKQYWHHGQVDSNNVRYQPKRNQTEKVTQTTRMRPVKAGISFMFSIHFENLSNVELGALIWILRTAEEDSDYRLKLGMGKPFGMGVIKIGYSLELTQRVNRYQQLFQDNQWYVAQEQITKDGVHPYERAFIDYIWANIDPQRTGKRWLSHIPRIKQLLTMLRWTDIFPASTVHDQHTQQRTVPWNEIVRYLEIERDQGKWNLGENEYSERRILPLPSEIRKED